MENTRLQVLIVAYKKEGLESIIRNNHPRVPGVEYIVSWQYADDAPDVPEALLEREDFKVYPTPTSGVATNRNLALSYATAPMALSGDDDVTYKAEELESVMKAFDAHPDIDFFTFRYFSPDFPRVYPEKEFSLNQRKLPKHYYATGVEMAWRTDVIRRHDIHFDELFGIGGYFCAAEEDLFLMEIRNHKIPGLFIPIDVCTHPGDTTNDRLCNTPHYIATKGAALYQIHPLTWSLRMIAHALRSRKGIADRIKYCAYWLKGVRDFRRLRNNRRKK